jgi:hypothetical protein
MTDYDTACKLRALAEQTSDPTKYRAAQDAFSGLGMISAAAALENRARYYERERPESWLTIAAREPCVKHDWRNNGGILVCRVCGICEDVR